MNFQLKISIFYIVFVFIGAFAQAQEKEVVNYWTLRKRLVGECTEDFFGDCNNPFVHTGANLPGYGIPLGQINTVGDVQFGKPNALATYSFFGTTKIEEVLPKYGQLKIADGVNTVSIGNANGQAFNYGFGMIGFNLDKDQNTQQWTVKSDGSNNGAAGIYSDAGGDLHFLTMKSDHNNQTKIVIDQQVSNARKMVIKADGGVGIGTTCVPSGFQLAVEGKIYAREIKVDLSDWCDYVFEKDYDLMNLDKLGEYVNKEHHLPEIPSSEEVQQNGLNIGDFQSKLLKKVEELTLYTIEQEKKLKALEEKLNKVLEIQKN